jgi:P4 family phage/plasmid primase-like protien
MEKTPRMIPSIDNLTDPWDVGNYLLLQFQQGEGFYINGRFYLKEDGLYRVIGVRELALVIMKCLKNKANQSAINLITERLSIELESKIEADPKVIAFTNGVYDLDIEDFVEGLQGRSVYQYMPFKYDASMPPVRWLKFLDDVFDGDEDAEQKKKCLQEFFGYCFLKDVNYHKALVLYGDGANGKSVILDVLGDMMPVVSRLEWSELSDQRNLGKLSDSWLNLCTEITYRDTNSTTGFKKAVAGEMMTANEKYQKPYDFRCFAKFVFATNGLPMTDDVSNGVFRRLIIINMNNSFMGREDWALTDKLRKEIPYIFSWAMQGARRLIDSRSFTYVPSNAAELKEYRRAINSLQSFYDEDLCMREGDEIPFNDFYTKYQEFCGQTGNRPFARNKIRALIRQLGLPLDVVSSMGNNRGIKAMQDINVVDGNENLPF